MEYQYTLDDGSHFLMSATDMSDLLDVMHGRRPDRRYDVPVHRADALVRQLERGLENMERNIEGTLKEIRERRAVREPDEWEPADD